MSAWRRPEARPKVTVDLPTLREVERCIEQRLAELETYGAGGCPTCRDAELRGILVRLRALARLDGDPEPR